MIVVKYVPLVPDFPQTLMHHAMKIAVVRVQRTGIVVGIGQEVRLAIVMEIDGMSKVTNLLARTFVMREFAGVVNHLTTP